METFAGAAGKGAVSQGQRVSKFCEVLWAKLPFILNSSLQNKCIFQVKNRCTMLVVSLSKLLIVCVPPVLLFKLLIVCVPPVFFLKVYKQQNLPPYPVSSGTSSSSHFQLPSLSVSLTHSSCCMPFALTHPALLACWLYSNILNRFRQCRTTLLLTCTLQKDVSRFPWIVLLALLALLFTHLHSPVILYTGCTAIYSPRAHVQISDHGHIYLTSEIGIQIVSIHSFQITLAYDNMCQDLANCW